MAKVKPKKVKVVAVKAVDPEIVVDIDLSGSGFVHPPDTITGKCEYLVNGGTINSTGSDTTYNQDKCVVSVKFADFQGTDDWGGALVLTITYQEGNDKKSFTKDYTLSGSIPNGNQPIQVSLDFEEVTPD